MEAFFGALLALLLIIAVALVRAGGDEDFDLWFAQLIECAPEKTEIDEFEENYWFLHYSEGLDPCAALDTEKYK